MWAPHGGGQHDRCTWQSMLQAVILWYVESVTWTAGPCVINITFLAWTQQELSRFSPPKPSAYLIPRAFLCSLRVIGSELTRERPEQNYKWVCGVLNYEWKGQSINTAADWEFVQLWSLNNTQCNLLMNHLKVSISANQWRSRVWWGKERFGKEKAGGACR
jgi:hypothetical protein